MFKNVAAKFMVFAFDATTNVPKTGDAVNITAYVSKDYGTVTVLGDTSATEMDATNAPGYYLFDAAQAETNGDCLMVSGKSATANIKVIGAPAVIYTRPTTGWLAPTVAGRTIVVDVAGLVDANMVKLGPTGSGTAQTARDIGLGVNVNAIGTQTAAASGGTVTFPANPIASTTNITAASGVVLSAAGVQAIWDALTSALTTVGSIGKWLVDKIDVVLSTRLASASYTAPDSAATIAAAVLTTQMTESYPALHAAPTLAQSQFEMRGLLAEKGVAGTTLTTKKVDGSTTAETFTLNDATAPTAITRAS